MLLERFNTDLKIDPSLIESSLPWRGRESFTIHSLRSRFEVNGAISAAYPVLRQFLAEEEALLSIKALGSVLAFHGVLFRALSGKSVISQDQASELSNMDAIRLLPSEEQGTAEAILSRYCDDFNRAFPLVALIYECEDNPFLHQGIVDLSGTGTGNGKQTMSYDTPVRFSLPFREVSGEVDAPAMCTIALLQHLQNVQNCLMDRIVASRGSVPVQDTQLKRMGDGKKGGRRGAQSKSRPPPDTVAPPPGMAIEEPKAPAISYLSGPELIDAAVVNYSRDRDLLPLLETHGRQALGLGTGGSIEYVYARIEATIANRLFSGKSHVLIHIPQYPYTGQLKKPGRFSSLSSRIPQEGLPASISERISEEINTQHRLTRLLAIIEDCVAFLVSIGAVEVILIFSAAHV